MDDPEYVNRILDRLRDNEPRTYASILYVEQPFPYDLERHQIDVRSVAARKPLFMDESAHDWTLVRLGRSLGWSGVALKTCKTQTGAILSLCWARRHGMTLMVQDLTNPMLAQIPHLQLAAHAGTIMGVETNAMQFYPAASAAEAQVHPGLYRRRDGHVDLGTLTGAGFGYRADEIRRTLPEPVCEAPRGPHRHGGNLIAERDTADADRGPGAVQPGGGVASWRCRSASLQSSSAASSAPTRGTLDSAAALSRNARRVRRDRTSSTVHAASWRAAYTASASR